MTTWNLASSALVKQEASATFLAPLLSEPGVSHALRVEQGGAVLAEHLETAFDRASRRKGLLGREALPAEVGLVLAPCCAIHTWFMRFPIDVLFVAQDGIVLKAEPEIGAWRMAGAASAFAVIELAAGALSRAHVRVGDRLLVVKSAPVDAGVPAETGMRGEGRTGATPVEAT